MPGRHAGGRLELVIFNCSQVFSPLGCTVRHTHTHTLDYMTTCSNLRTLAHSLLFIHLTGPLVARAALYTAGVVGGLTLTAACAPSEKYLHMSGPLSLGLGVVVVASLGQSLYIIRK